MLAGYHVYGTIKIFGWFPFVHGQKLKDHDKYVLIEGDGMHRLKLRSMK